MRRTRVRVHCSPLPRAHRVGTGHGRRPGRALAKAEAKARADAAAKVRPHVDIIPLDVDTHALRHVNASALIAGGASEKVVQTRLGHSSAVVTLPTYGLWARR